MVDPKRLRNLIRATPFRRFALVTKDSVRIEVTKPYGIGLDPTGRFVVLGDPPVGVRSMVPVSDFQELVIEAKPSKKTAQTVAKIRELRNASPFVPFQVITDDGRKLVVDRSFQIGISPSERELCYAGSPTDFVWFNPARIRQVKRVAG